MTQPKQRFFRRLAPLAGLLLFALVLTGIAHALEKTHLHQILDAFQALPGKALLQALGLTLLSYLLLSGYDALALHHLGRRLPYPRVALTAFSAYALSHNIGPGLITGGSVRYRLYSVAGLTSSDIAAIIVLSALGFSLGVTFMVALALLAEPSAFADVLHLRPPLLQAIGILLLLALAAYLLWTGYRRAPLRWRDWSFQPPSLRFSLAQLALSSVDLLLASAVLYVLLPPSLAVSYPALIGLYSIALTLGILSHVPGGLGVFEGSLLLLLPAAPVNELVASLLVFRGIYYLLPLGLMAAALAGYELSLRLRGVRQLSLWLARLLMRQAPLLLAALVFVAGAILLLTGALPAWPERLALLRGLVPLPALELSHLLTSVIGLGLLVVARGLQQRLDGAYLLALALLTASIVFALLRGLDYASAGVAAIALLALLPSRPLFYRRASLLREPFTTGWATAVLTVLLSTIWLGGFVYKHVEYSNELWWQFAFSGNASRFLRASLLVSVLTGAFALTRLLQPAAPQPTLPTKEQLNRALDIIQSESQDTHAHLALTGDKYLLFSPDQRGFLMYALQGNSWITLGGPVGQGGDELVWSLCELCDWHRARPVFYQIDAQALPLYIDLGMAVLKLGEEAQVPLTTFSLQGRERRELRQAHRHAERAGASFELIQAEAVAELLPTLQQISDDWLATKHAAEKRFSIGFFQPDYLCRLPCALVRVNGEIVAFANVLMSAARQELSVDLMRYRRTAPRGMMDYLFVELMLWGQREGFASFNLGMAPLAGMASHPLAPAWQRAGVLLFRHGEHFYNFEGLQAYKAKFAPRWYPKYLACPGSFDLPRVILDVATLIGGGLKGVLKR